MKNKKLKFAKHKEKECPFQKGVNKHESQRINRRIGQQVYGYRNKEKCKEREIHEKQAFI